MIDFATVPNWIAWRYEDAGRAKPAKVPYNPASPVHRLRRASVTNPLTWGRHVQAAKFAAAAGMDGLGLVLTPKLGVTLVDLDNCFDDAGDLLPYAAAIVAGLNSYTERSPSGKGLHILVKGAVAALKTDQVELYSQDRFTTVTGNAYGPVRAIRAGQSELDELRTQYAPPEDLPPHPVEKARSTDTHPIDTSDEAVIAILGSVPKYAPLWAGNFDGNRSSAVFSLVNGLIWLCGPDEQRVGRLFRQSGLYDPDRHERNSGGGRANIDVTIYNAVQSWRGTPYQWPQARPAKRTATIDPDPEPEPPDPPAYKRKKSDLPPDSAERATLAAATFAPRTNIDGDIDQAQAYILTPEFTAQHGNSRTHKNDVATLFALLQVARQSGRFDGLPASLARLGRIVNLSTSTVRASLARLVTAGYIEKVSSGDNITLADVYDIKPENFTCTNRHTEPLFLNTVPFVVCELPYADHVADDEFSTGGGGLGSAFRNEEPAAGKDVLFAINAIQGADGPVTVAQCCELTGWNYRKCGRVLYRGAALGILERMEVNGYKQGRRFWYSVPADWEQRSALAGLESTSFGAGLDRAANGAWGLQIHADKLLEKDKERPNWLSDSQRATLQAWVKLGDLDYKLLCRMADLAEKLDKSTVRATILAAATEETNQRLLRAVSEFSQTVLQNVEIKPGHALRLFRTWAGVTGYNDLATNAPSTQRRIYAALRHTVTLSLPLPKAPPTPRRLDFAYFADMKQAEAAAAYAQRFGVPMPAMGAA